MKAAAYEEIDGFRAVRSIGEPTIDPETTIAEVRRLVEQTPEFCQFRRVYLMCATRTGAGSAEIDESRALLPALAGAVERKRREFLAEHAVYFTVPGEINVDDATAESLRSKLSELEPRELLTLEGEVIPDHRGRTAWELDASGEWRSTKIDRIGVACPNGHTWAEDLSPAEVASIRDQTERRRIEAMSEDERKAWADDEIDAALDSLAHRLARAQIIGDDSSVVEIRATYGTVRQRILEKYKLDLDEVKNGS